MRRSLDVIDELATQTGNPFEINRRGYVYLGTDESSTPSLANYNTRAIGGVRENPDDYTLHNPGDLRGLDLLTGEETVHQTFPFVADYIEAALHVRRAGWFRTPILFNHLLDEAKRHGVKMVRGSMTQISLETDGLRAVRVELESGNTVTISTDILISAAGPYIAQSLTCCGAGYPVYNVLQQKFDFQDTENIIPRDMPFMILTDPVNVDWTPEEREYIATLEPDFDGDTLPGNIHIKPDDLAGGNWVKMGWALNRRQDEPSDAPELDPRFAAIVMKAAAQTIPGLAAYVENPPSEVKLTGGYYTRTPENLPIIGPTERSGVYVIGALSGYGVMAACGAGELIADWAVGADLPSYADDLSPARYRNPAYVRGVGSGWCKRRVIIYACKRTQHRPF